MEGFSIGKIYVENAKRIVEINPLPENYCSFDCLFCPLGKTRVKTDKSFFFPENEHFLSRLKDLFQKNQLNMVFINPNGEALANQGLRDILILAKTYKLKVKLLTNGYLLNNPEYKAVIELCDIVIGELAVTSEKDFQKLLRPLSGYTLDEYINNLVGFRQWFKGEFHLDVTVIKGYSDTREGIEYLKKTIKRLNPHKVFFETPEEKRLKGAFLVPEERLREIELECMSFLE